MFISTVRRLMNGSLVAMLGREVFCPQLFLFFYFNDVIERTLQLKAYSNDIAQLAPSKTELQPLSNVKDCKYLGVKLTETLPVDKDTDRMTSSFLKQFNSLFYEFNCVDRKVLTFLFRTYTSSFYGLKNWTLTGCKRNFQKKIHLPIRKLWKDYAQWMCGRATMMLVRSRRCIFLNICMPSVVQLLCIHYLNRIARVLSLKNYFQLKSFAVESFRECFLQEHQLLSLFSSPLCAVNSRINFVENNERSSGVLKA